MKRIIRKEKLTDKEAAEDEATREKIAAEFPKETNLSIMNEKKANLIFDLLIVFFGAQERLRFDFIQYLTKEPDDFKEFRFGGSLGSGGKFKSNMGELYVCCYSEHETELDRVRMNLFNDLIKRINFD